jgi:hypothetical protein
MPFPCCSPAVLKTDSHIPCRSPAITLPLPCHSHWPLKSEIGMILITTSWNYLLPHVALFHTGHLATAIGDWYSSDNKLPGTGRGSSKGHKLESREHAVNMPSPCRQHAITLPSPPCHGLERSLTERHIRGMVGERHGNGITCVNQTRPHNVNQIGKTQSKSLAERHGTGTAGEQHGNGMVCVNRP